MTKAELINEIKNRIGFDTDNETYAMSKDERDFYTSILKILEQELCDDAVSRQALLDEFKDGTEGYDWAKWTRIDIIDAIEALPPVLPKRERSDKE